MFQNTKWSRFILEACVIVTSILLAFTIDALWTDYQVREEEQEILSGLQREFSRHLETIQIAKGRVTDTAAAIDFLLSKQGISPESREEITEIELAVFSSSFASPGLELRGGVRDALLESGRLETISDTGLRQLLADWAVVVDETESHATVIREFLMQSLMPHLATLNVPLPEVLVPLDRGFGPTNRQTISPELKNRYSQLLLDNTYLNLLAVRRWWAGGSLHEYESATDRAQEILERIEGNLRPRSGI